MKITYFCKEDLYDSYSWNNPKSFEIKGSLLSRSNYGILQAFNLLKPKILKRIKGNIWIRCDSFNMYVANIDVPNTCKKNKKNVQKELSQMFNRFLTSLHSKLYQTKAVVRELFFKICFLKDFAIFPGKHLCLSLFLIKLQASSTMGLFCF